MSSEPFRTIHLDRVDSTNAEAKRQAQRPNAEGLAVFALEQTAGRGSQGREWLSPQGGLYASVLLRAKAPHPPTTLSILAGAAAAQTVRECLPKSFDVTVKWPNDVLVDGKKVAGVLCEALEDAPSPLCVIGIGINVNLTEEQLKPFAGNPFPAASFLTLTGGAKHRVEEVGRVLMRKLFSLHNLYWEEGFEPIARVWENNCLAMNRRLRFRSDGTETEATLLGIDPTGALVLSNPLGEHRSHSVGEITCFLP